MHCGIQPNYFLTSETPKVLVQTILNRLKFIVQSSNARADQNLET